MTKKALTLSALTVAALSFAGCKTNLISDGEQIRMGQTAAAELETKVGVSRNPEDNNFVERIGRKIVTSNKLTKWPFSFKVLNAREVNAVSLPGGPVYFFRGLIDLLEGNEDEAGCIAAHEIAHIQHEHVAKAISQGMLADLAISVGLGGDLQTGAQIVSALAQLKFSRQDEYQADTAGIEYAYRAGIDPNGLIVFFQKLQRLEKSGNGDVVSNNLRTHPLTAARIERAKKEVARITKKVNVEVSRAVDAERTKTR
jgi:predicted Zn-dependent protease